MADYTINLVTNPSAELSADGFVAVNSTVTQVFDESLFGSASINVQTDASSVGQGVYTPKVIFTPAPGDDLHYSASLHIKSTGTGNVYVQLVNNEGGVILGTRSVALTDSWQRITIDNVTIPQAYTELYLLVTTSSHQVLNFWVDGVQVENNTVSTEYCDGDQYGCDWLGDPGASASHRYVEFLFSSHGSDATSGAFSVIITGAAFDISSAGFDQSDGTFSASALDRVAVFDDFAMYPIGQPDPAMTYIAQTNAGMTDGAFGEATTRHYALAYPPLEYPVSEGTAWSRAVYAAVGFKYVGITPNNFHYLDGVQLEKFHFDTTTTNYSSTVRYSPGDVVVSSSHKYRCLAPAFNNPPSGALTNNTYWRYIGETWEPSEFVNPRHIRTVVKPTQINLVQNPSFESSTNYWTADGNVTIATDSVSVTPEIGSKALLITVAGNNLANPGCYIDVDQLIVGRQYTASAYIQGSAQLFDVLMSMGNVSVSVTGDGIPYGGDATADPDPIGYGQGPYGGVYPPGSSSNFPAGQWIRVSLTFTATAYTHRLRFVGSFVTSPTFPIPFWIDAVMVEEGEVVHDYVDGSLGSDYLWEADGTPNESRSYFYDGRHAKVYILQDLAQENVPIGITGEDPIFAQPYTQ